MIEQLQDILSVEFEFTKDIYTWSTWIFPDGSYIAIDTFSGDDSAYSEVLYEHAHVLEYLEDIGVEGAERILEDNCIKINFSDPYITLPIIKRPTQDQWRTLEATIEFIYATEGMNAEVARYISSDIILVGHKDNSFLNTNLAEETTFIPIITSRYVFLFDELLFTPKDIIKELKQLIRY